MNVLARLLSWLVKIWDLLLGAPRPVVATLSDTSLNGFCLCVQHDIVQNEYHVTSKTHIEETC